MEKDLTSGNVWKNILYFSLPYLLSYFLQTLYGMADLFIVGQFDGVASTTAVSIGSQVMHMLTVMIVGLEPAIPKKYQRLWEIQRFCSWEFPLSWQVCCCFWFGRS